MAQLLIEVAEKLRITAGSLAQPLLRISPCRGEKDPIGPLTFAGRTSTRLSPSLAAVKAGQSKHACRQGSGPGPSLPVAPAFVMVPVGTGHQIDFAFPGPPLPAGIAQRTHRSGVALRHVRALRLLAVGTFDPVNPVSRLHKALVVQWLCHTGFSYTRRVVAFCSGCLCK